MEALEQRLGYTFTDRSYLETALTHSSYANELPQKRHSNERLEFLGDAELVCETSLHQVALALGLGDYIHLGRNEQCNGGRTRPSILADCVEAVIAAIFLDGGLEPAERFIGERILGDIRAGHRPARTDYKTQLQELMQREGGMAPTYAIVNETGPDHDKTFTASVALPGGESVQGTGKSKKEAEQSAARAALERLGG